MVSWWRVPSPSSRAARSHPGLKAVGTSTVGKPAGRAATILTVTGEYVSMVLHSRWMTVFRAWLA